MKTNIIQIGNSKGIILPSDILRKLHLSIKSAISISVEGEKIVIRSEPRQGWAEAAKQMHASGDDTLLISDVFNDEDLSGITWNDKTERNVLPIVTPCYRGLGTSVILPPKKTTYKPFVHFLDMIIQVTCCKERSSQ